MEMPFNFGNQKLSKVIGILNRLNHVYSQNALLSIYHSLFAFHLNYGLLLWGTHVNRVSKLQKVAVRIMSNSEYLESVPIIMKFINFVTYTSNALVTQQYLGQQTLFVSTTYV